MLSPIGDRLALLASLLSAACGCARSCPRCSLRAVDRAAGRQPGHLAAIVAGAQTDLTCGGAASYARALGASPAWVAFGAGPCVDEGALARLDDATRVSLLALDPSEPTHHGTLGAYLLDALGHATARADAPVPATTAVRPRRRAPRTVTPRRGVRKPRERRGLRTSEARA